MSRPDADGDPGETARGSAGRPRDPALDEAIIVATRRRLVLDGYSRMTLGDIAADAGVSRPTLYRRWPGKYELVVDALDWGLRTQVDRSAPLDIDTLTPYEAFREAVRRVDPCYSNPDAIVLQGNFIGERQRVPELLDLLRERAVEPRMALLRDVLVGLRDRGHVRPDVDVETVTTLCFGSYFGAFLRGRPGGEVLAANLAAALWPGLEHRSGRADTDQQDASAV